MGGTDIKDHSNKILSKKLIEKYRILDLKRGSERHFGLFLNLRKPEVYDHGIISDGL